MVVSTHGMGIDRACRWRGANTTHRILILFLYTQLVLNSCRLVYGLGTYMDPAVLGVNNGPIPYRRDLGELNMLVGGISPAGGTHSMANTGDIASIYKAMNVPGVRPNDLGGPFDLRCLFQIETTDDIPSPDSTFEEIRDDPRWNWTSSDEVFVSMLENGFAPYLNLASREWVSGLQQGWAHVDKDGIPQYVVNPESLKYFCVNWPYISPIMESIGDKLVLTIVERYNNVTMWGRYLKGTAVYGPPLEWETWAGVTNATVGIELQNEYNGLTCLKTGNGDTTSLEGWKENCGGSPYTWNWKYWDGTPEAAHRSYVSQALAIKSRFPGIRVGGPAIGTGPSFGLTPSSNGVLPADGAALDWIRSFLRTVKDSTRQHGVQMLDWFSWHAYTSCQTLTESVDCSRENPTSILGIAARMRSLLDAEGFGGLPMVISEHNAKFKVNGGNTYPGNTMGAAVTAVHIAGIVLSKDEFKIDSAYIVNGIDGPFLPYNKNSFPLSCTPEYVVQASENAPMGPERIAFSGKYIDDCSHGSGSNGAMSINSANGMGLLYSNGDKKPSAVVFEDVMSQFVFKDVNPVPTPLPASVVGMYADDSDVKKCISLLLVNADLLNYSPILPHLSQMSPMPNIDESKVQVLQVGQTIRGSGIILPNNISSLGTVQVEGQIVKKDLQSTTGMIMLQDGRIRLPPAGIVVFSSMCSGQK